MLIAVSDTHRETDPQLTNHLRTVLRDAEHVLHAGDFTTPAVLKAFESRSSTLTAVVGNRDAEAVRNQLAETQTVEWAGRRFVLVHGHQRGPTSSSLLARQEQADVVVMGHTHRPTIRAVDDRTLVNPGSHADPRGNRAAYAAFEQETDGVVVELRTTGGEVFERAVL